MRVQMRERKQAAEAQQASAGCAGGQEEDKKKTKKTGLGNEGVSVLSTETAHAEHVDGKHAQQPDAQQVRCAHEQTRHDMRRPHDPQSMTNGPRPAQPAHRTLAKHVAARSTPHAPRTRNHSAHDRSLAPARPGQAQHSHTTISTSHAEKSLRQHHPELTGPSPRDPQDRC